MAKNDFRFVDEIANSYEKSLTNQTMFSDYKRLASGRQKLTSELKETQ